MRHEVVEGVKGGPIYDEALGGGGGEGWSYDEA